jgi:rubrerythrin
MLSGAGFKEVYSMSGGIDAWNGLKAAGAPESGMVVFSGSNTPEELIELAWALEDGSRLFYETVAELLVDPEAKGLFENLVTAEEHHKAKLFKLYREFPGSEDLDDSSFQNNSEGLMEGGVRVSAGLDWAKGKDALELLQFSMSLETNAYDLYLKMIRFVPDENSRRVLNALADEEKIHLENMGTLLEKRV